MDPEDIKRNLAKLASGMTVRYTIPDTTKIEAETRINRAAEIRGYRDGFNGELPAYDAMFTANGKKATGRDAYLKAYAKGTKDNPNPLDPSKLC